MKKLLSAALGAVMLLSCVPAGAAQYVEDDDTVLYVDFEDSLPDGCTNTGMTYGEGVYGKAGVFDGSASVKLPDDITAGITDFTMAAWVKFDVLTSWQRVVDLGNGESNFAFIGLATGSNIRGSLKNGGGTEEKLSSNESSVLAVAGEWTHIAMVQSGGARTLYVNGTKVHELTGTTYTMDAIGSSTSNYIGDSQFSGDPGLDGSVDELILAKRAMTEDEIKSLAEVSAQVLSSYVDLGDTSTVTSDLTLPTEANGASVSWETSDVNVITADGIITRQVSEDKPATLTAIITLGSVTATKDFEITVKKLTSAFDFEIGEKVRGNLDLPATLDGAEIEWTSSDENVISTKAIENGDYTIPAGKVTRGDEDVDVTLTAEITYGDYTETKTYNLTVEKKAEELGEMGGYLYVYFKGNVNGEAEDLKIHLAASEDGYKWYDMNGNYPILASDLGTECVRDPFLFRSHDGDRFYLIATDLNTQDGGGWAKWSLEGSKYLIVWESDDLVNWSDARMVKFANDDIGCAWAPEAIWDPDTEEYLVYAAGKDLTMDDPLDTVYVVRTRDFRTFSEPEYFTVPTDSDGNRKAAIDTNIIQGDDGRFYQFYKFSNYKINMRVADHASGPYEEVEAFNNLDIRGEGPATYKVNGTNQYCLCVDDYTKYVPYLSDDIASGIFTMATADVTMPTGSKHGGMVPVTVEEYDRVMAKYGPNLPEAELGDDAAYSYDFETEDSEKGTLYGNAKIAYDETKGSNVLELDGTDGSYFEFPENLFDEKDEFTLSFDIRNDSTSDSNHMAFAMGKNSYVYFFYKPNPTSMRAAITNQSWSSEEAAAPTGMTNTAGEWMHIDLVVSPRRIAIYKNSVLAAENTDVMKTVSHMGTDVPAYLGKSVYSADPYFDGAIDNVVLNYRALSAAEIAGEPLIYSCGAVVDGESLNVTVDVENVSSAKILAIGYGADGEAEAVSEVTDGAVTLPAGEIKTVKVFVWENLESMRPLCKAKEVEVK